ncbi:MAG TPA: hypothetical protein VLN59_12540 [Burkholderiales bacterium]|nr:hypothetical protein [Burkholderiales bacterium]
MGISSRDTAAPHYDVTWPLSRKGVNAVRAAPRIPDLNGKTIAELWDVLFRGETIYPQVREYIKARFPGVRFVGHEVFGNFHGPREYAIHATLADKLREYGCDAAIVGIGA